MNNIYLFCIAIGDIILLASASILMIFDNQVRKNKVIKLALFSLIIFALLIIFCIFGIGILTKI